MNTTVENKPFAYSSYDLKEISSCDDKDGCGSNGGKDGDEDLEALRLAALQSLQYKKIYKDLSNSSLNINKNHGQHHCYKIPNINSSGSTVCNKFSQQINKNSFYHFQQKSNLIEIVPKDVNIIVMDKEPKKNTNSTGAYEYLDYNKFNDVSKPKIKNIFFQNACSTFDSQSEIKKFKNIESEDSKTEVKIEKNIDDYDDIILMSDHEEEDSLERLMNEMEKEINVTQLSKKGCLRNFSPNIITSKEQFFTNLEDRNKNSRYLRKISSCTKYRSLSPKSAIHLASEEKPRKLIIKPQYHISKRNSSSIVLHSKLERSLGISKTDIEVTSSKLDNIDFKSMKSKPRSKLCSSSSKSLYKDETALITQKYKSENLFSKTMSQNTYQPSNDMLSHNISSREFLDQSNSVHSAKLSISFNAINVCCRNYSMICCKKSNCVLNERFKNKESQNGKSNFLSSTKILEARRRKFESIKPMNFIASNKKIRITSDAKRNLNIMDSNKDKKNIKEILNFDTNFFNVSDKTNNYPVNIDYFKKEETDHLSEIQERKVFKKIRRRKENEFNKITKIKNDIYKKKKRILKLGENIYNGKNLNLDDTGDLRTELSRRRAERLNKLIPIQSARLLQSAFKEVDYGKKLENKS